MLRDKKQENVRNYVSELTMLNHTKKALRENRCPPRLIHNLARVYFGEDANFPSNKPVDHLHDFLGGNEYLIEAVLKAFRESVIRSDVPDEAEIIQTERGQ